MAYKQQENIVVVFTPFVLVAVACFLPGSG